MAISVTGERGLIGATGRNRQRVAHVPHLRRVERAYERHEPRSFDRLDVIQVHRRLALQALGDADRHLAWGTPARGCNGRDSSSVTCIAFMLMIVRHSRCWPPRPREE